jgi:hypothetical protein
MRRANIFPPLLTYLTASGEAAGQLDTMLERAADYLEREFDTLHRDGAVAARTGDHRHHGRHRRDDRAIDPAADPSARNLAGQ